MRRSALKWKPFPLLLIACVPLSLLLIACAPLGATVLTFEVTDCPPTQGTLPPCVGEDLSQDYGDRVTAAVQGIFSYGADAGFTPNIVVEYGPEGGNFDLWFERFGDLTWVIDNNNEAQDALEIDFTADDGFSVFLESFDLARINLAFDPNPNPVPFIDIWVFDSGSGDVLFSAFDVLVEGESGHTDIDFVAPIVGQSLTLRLDLTSLGAASDNVGIDNLTFGQLPAPTRVPEPNQSATFVLVVSGLVFRAWRGRKS